MLMSPCRTPVQSTAIKLILVIFFSPLCGRKAIVYTTRKELMLDILYTVKDTYSYISDAVLHDGAMTFATVCAVGDEIRKAGGFFHSLAFSLTAFF